MFKMIMVLWLKNFKEPLLNMIVLSIHWKILRKKQEY